MSKKCFSNQIEPHTATLSFSVVLKHFTVIDQKLSFRTKKCFSNQIEPYTAKLSFSAVLKHFYRNWEKNCLLGQKSVFLTKLSHIQLN